MQYLYKGLRNLSPSETPCPSDLLSGLLRDIGWKLALEGPLALLMHNETGIFIEIPNCHSASSTSTGKPEPLPTLSSFEIDFRCAEPSSFELWHGDRLIKSGLGEEEEMNVIAIDSSDLFHCTDRFGSAIPIDVPENKNAYDTESTYASPTAGSQMLMLMVYARDPHEKETKKKDKKKVDKKPLFTNIGTQADGRVLLHTTYIRIHKGFRLGFLENEDDDSDDDSGSLQLEERVIIAGITRVVTYMENDLGTLAEFFEPDPCISISAQGPSLHKKSSPLGNEPHEDLFGRCLLSVNTVLAMPQEDFIPEKNKGRGPNEGIVDEGPTHVRVVDRAVALSLLDPLESTVVEHRTDETESATTISGIKEIVIDQPVLSGDINIHRCSREFFIQLIKKPTHNGADDMVKDEVLAHSDVYGHAAVHMRSESQVMPFNVTRSALPHLIHSHKHGVYIRVACPIEEPPARLKHLYALYNQTVTDETESEQRLNSFYGGQWYFLVDRNSIKLVSSAVMDPTETVDLTFFNRGFVAELKGYSNRCVAAMDGRHVKGTDVEDLPKTMKAVLSKLQFMNHRGMSSQFSDAPLYLRGKWSELVKHSLHRKVVNSMLSLVERARVVAAGRSAQEAAAITKEYEAYAAATAAANTRGKGVDIHIKKEAENKVAKIMNATLPTIDLTFRDVYSDMTRMTNEMAQTDVVDDKKDVVTKSEALRLYAMSSMMNVKNLVAFLLRETLPGFDEPLSTIQAGVVLESLERNPSTHAVKVEQFALWYKLDDEKQLRAELKAKRVFASLLEEITQPDDVICAADQEDKILRGSSAKRIIRDMHIGADDLKKWFDQETELISSSTFNEGMDYYPQAKVAEKRPSMTSHRGMSSFFKPPKLPVLNPRKGLSSLSNFIKNISNRRKDKQAGVGAGVGEESKLDDIDLRDDSGQLIGGGSRPAAVAGNTDITAAPHSLRSIKEGTEVDGDKEGVSEFSENNSDKEGEEGGDSDSSSEEWEGSNGSESSDEDSDDDSDDDSDESDADRDENESEEEWDVDTSGTDGVEIEATSPAKDRSAPEFSL